MGSRVSKAWGIPADYPGEQCKSTSREALQHVKYSIIQEGQLPETFLAVELLKKIIARGNYIKR